MLGYTCAAITVVSPIIYDFYCNLEIQTLIKIFVIFNSLFLQQAGFLEGMTKIIPGLHFYS
jgi:hypothetical protein